MHAEMCRLVPCNGSPGLSNLVFDRSSHSANELVGNLGYNLWLNSTLHVRMRDAYSYQNETRIWLFAVGKPLRIQISRPPWDMKRVNIKHSPRSGEGIVDWATGRPPVFDEAAAGV